MVDTKGRGRRKGDSGARATILASARATFAETGYDAATIRAIATSAGVDPALVHHYFGNKEQLFIAAMELPVNPADVVKQVLGEGKRSEAGVRLVRTFLGVWDDPKTASPVVALLRGAMSHQRSAQMLREFMVGVILRAVVIELGGDRPELRAGLVGSQLLGLAAIRHILQVPALTSPSAEELASLVGPNIQRYLTGKLPG